MLHKWEVQMTVPLAEAWLLLKRELEKFKNVNIFHSMVVVAGPCSSMSVLKVGSGDPQRTTSKVI